MAAPERIAIVGLGLIGGSLALALRRARPQTWIIGIDVDARALEQATEGRAIDGAATPGPAPPARASGRCGRPPARRRSSTSRRTRMIARSGWRPTCRTSPRPRWLKR